MVHDLEAGPLGNDLAVLVGRVALGVAATAAVLLLLALLTELLRRRNRAGRFLALLDAALPAGARTAAVSILAITATFVGTRPAAADDSVRGWLGRPTTSTSQPVRVATPEAVDELVEPTPPPTITGPVVLVPPAVEERPPATAPTPIGPAAPTPPVIAPAPVLPTYVVQPGDCLWAIAARILGPRADGRASHLRSQPRRGW